MVDGHLGRRVAGPLGGTLSAGMRVYIPCLWNRNSALQLSRALRNTVSHSTPFSTSPYSRTGLPSAHSSLATSFCQYSTPSTAHRLLSILLSSSFPPTASTTPGTRPYPMLIAFLARSIRLFIPAPLGGISEEDEGVEELPVRRTSSRAFSRHARAWARLPRERPRIRSAL